MGVCLWPWHFDQLGAAGVCNKEGRVGLSYQKQRFWGHLCNSVAILYRSRFKLTMEARKQSRKSFNTWIWNNLLTDNAQVCQECQEHWRTDFHGASLAFDAVAPPQKDSVQSKAPAPGARSYHTLRSSSSRLIFKCVHHFVRITYPYLVDSVYNFALILPSRPVKRATCSK